MGKTRTIIIYLFVVLFPSIAKSQTTKAIEELLRASDIVFFGAIADSQASTETLYARVVEPIKGARGLQGTLVPIFAPEPIVNVVLTSLKNGVFFLQKLDERIYKITPGSIGFFNKRNIVINELAGSYSIKKSGIIFLAISWGIILLLLFFSYFKILS